MKDEVVNRRKGTSMRLTECNECFAAAAAWSQAHDLSSRLRTLRVLNLSRRALRRPHAHGESHLTPSRLLAPRGLGRVESLPYPPSLPVALLTSSLLHFSHSPRRCFCTRSPPLRCSSPLRLLIAAHILLSSLLPHSLIAPPLLSISLIAHTQLAAHSPLSLLTRLLAAASSPHPQRCPTSTPASRPHPRLVHAARLRFTCPSGAASQPLPTLPRAHALDAPRCLTTPSPPP
ncbi:hypothetical protein K438DRAFT_2027716 [Mycena galopus ATCC 62051]|nr:hypothetical protein K438DRAFT_2027716 [Mycena galopus ATCC 62051]